MQTTCLPSGRSATQPWAVAKKSAFATPASQILTTIPHLHIQPILLSATLLKTCLQPGQRILPGMHHSMVLAMGRRVATGALKVRKMARRLLVMAQRSGHVTPSLVEN
jgi:hypothetical protein